MTDKLPNEAPEQFMLNGIADEITRMEQGVRCPFCNRKLRFQDAYTKAGLDNIKETITLRCKKCRMSIHLSRSPDAQSWKLERLSGHYKW